jgi:drug/metabolite transporter (DMT)-like permease
MTASGHPNADIELRIHGVSGTPVEAMLDVGTVHRVAGDDNAGFWRRGDVGDADILSSNDTILEGYRWGGLTSGATTAAIWVFLAPFALVNAAAAAHLPGTSKAEERRGIAPGIEGTLLRWFALSLSLTFVLTAYIASVDVVGWQCGNPLDPNGANAKPFCTRHSASTRFLSWHFLDTPARHIVVTMLGPLVVLGIVWFLARKSWQRYEGYPVGSAHGFVRGEATRTPFDDPAFWDGRERAEMLRHLHIAGCLAGLSAMVLWVRIVIRPQGWSSAVVPVLMAMALVVLTAVVIVVGFTVIPARRNWARVLLIAAAAVMAGTLATTWFSELRHTTSTPTATVISRFPAELPGVAEVVTVLFAVQLAVVLALWAAGVATRRKSPPPVRDIGLKGCTSPALCVISLVLAGAFSAGTIMRVADLLGSPRPRTEIGSRRLGQIVTPDAFTWMARGAVAAAVVIAVWAVVVGVVQSRFATTLAGEYDRPLTSLFPDPATAKVRDAAGEQRTKKVRRTIAIAQLTDRAGLILGPAAAIALVFAATATAFAFLGDSNHLWGFLTDPQGNAWRTWTASTGSWLLVGFAAALVGLTFSAYRDVGQRRQVGIIFDLASFWPRSAHPLGPPCYAERAVPEYAARSTFHRYGPLRFDDTAQTADDVRTQARQGGHQVVLSAHSQGTIIAAAALLQLHDLTGLRLLTYGCPLDRLYARYFPSYFGGNTLDSLLERLATPRKRPTTGDGATCTGRPTRSALRCSRGAPPTGNPPPAIRGTSTSWSTSPRRSPRATPCTRRSRGTRATRARSSTPPPSHCSAACRRSGGQRAT